MKISHNYQSFILFQADKLAAGFFGLGLERGDCVAIWSPNYEFWYVSMLAIARAGLVCVKTPNIFENSFNAIFLKVALNPAYQLPELDYCLRKVGVKAIIAPEAFRKQSHYQMLMSLVPDLKSNKTNALRNIIIASDKNLP